MSYEKPPARSGVPDLSPSRGRRKPPASAGLPSADRKLSADERRRARHPADQSKPRLEKVQDIIAAATAVLTTGVSPQKAAAAVGVDATGKSVKELIAVARAAFARRATDYVDLHFQAASVAAEDGDARPAQWAIENIVEGTDRIIEPAKSVPQSQPTGVRIGIAIGGIPGGVQSAHQPAALHEITVSELPAESGPNAAILDTP